MRSNEIIDLAGIDALAAGNDDVGRAVAKLVEAARVATHHVADREIVPEGILPSSRAASRAIETPRRMREISPLCPSGTAFAALVEKLDLAGALGRSTVAHPCSVAS
jgi:hypothetical protein